MATNGQKIIGRYTGPAYNFGPDPEGTLGPKDDINVVVTSIVNILTTEKYSVPHEPLLGSFVPSLLFDLNDERTHALVRYYTIKDLTDQEPRIVVLACYTQQVDEHSLEVMVSFKLVGDPTGKVHNAPITFETSLL